LCTLILLRRPGHEWPLLVAANRDELASRPAEPPARHWPDRPEVTAGLDEQAGGSWLGLNDWGVMAAVLNRRGSLGPAEGKRSRGELVLEALDHADANAAAEALAALDPHAYRPFNLVVADATAAFWIRHGGDENIVTRPIGEGLTMLTSGEPNDAACARTRRYRSLFERADLPDPARGDWSTWRLLLGSRASETGEARDAMYIVTDGEYGTRSSSLVALPEDPLEKPVWLFAEGAPDEADWVEVDL
jgi:uncharacterized protein with NRDE domain